MKMYYLLVSLLVFHQAVAMEVETNKLMEAMSEITAAVVNEKVKNVICPDGQSECPDGSTCCKLASGQWGCCPLPNAVCCSDHEHCCPHGYTCSEGNCVRGSDLTSLVKKTPAIQVKNVICPDGQSECPDGSTCCKLASGQWGCCPLPNAVCCSDHEHCCPHGYTCSEGNCVRGSDLTSLVKKTPAIQVKNVVCPGGKYVCPTGSTCCKLASGQWGCCPLPEAVCCSDHVHCCPNGYTCTSGGSCQRGSDLTSMVKKTPAIQVKNVVCPGGGAQCPDGSTCCKLPSGQWGCCPLPNAVCCSDHEHCCPHGTTCDLSAGKCVQKTGPVTQLFRRKPASKVAEPVKNK